MKNYEEPKMEICEFIVGSDIFTTSVSLGEVGDDRGGDSDLSGLFSLR